MLHREKPVESDTLPVARLLAHFGGDTLQVEPWVTLLLELRSQA